MDIHLCPPMLPSRPCRFRVCVQEGDGCAFADFDVDEDGRVFAVRASFDGHGCCTTPADIGRMNAADSKALLEMVERGAFDATAPTILRTYFRENRAVFWDDALIENGLLNATPFRERVVWWRASVIAFGFERTVDFTDIDSGAVTRTISLGDDHFGYFGPPDGNVLYILGWRNVIAVDPSLAIKWVSENVAIDGITWRGQDGDRIQLSAEMDPPGGWVDVDLDAATGRRLPAPGT